MGRKQEHPPVREDSKWIPRLGQVSDLREFVTTGLRYFRPKLPLRVDNRSKIEKDRHGCVGKVSRKCTLNSTQDTATYKCVPL